jgi:novobiocin biosynthesis protein NovU/D-mycarose 3-C-methyltransferase
MITTRTTCRVCGSDKLAVLIDYGKLPLAGGFLLPEERHLDTAYPLRLAWCGDCTLMQVLDGIEPDMIFRRYSYAASVTQTVVDHFERMAIELVEQEDAAGRLVVEFGCNDGVLIRPLALAGATVVGVDPSDVARKASRSQGWTLFNDYFTEDVAARILKEYGPARIVTANNTFAHTDDVHTIMHGIDALLADDGVFVFEVHYQGDMLRKVQFDAVYHEHTCYYSLASLDYLMSEYGLDIIDVKQIPMQSGSIRVTAARKDANRKRNAAVDWMIDHEAAWDIGKFVRDVQSCREGLLELIQHFVACERTIAAYGGGGRATTLLNYCQLDAEMIRYIVDMSPLRHGRFVPGVQIPIVAETVFRADRPDYALLTAWTHEAEIVAKESAFLKDGGRFLVPLPETRIVRR